MDYLNEFAKNYIGSMCCRDKCKNEAKFIFMIGEADIPVCDEHKELAKLEIGNIFIPIYN